MCVVCYSVSLSREGERERGRGREEGGRESPGEDGVYG